TRPFFFHIKEDWYECIRSDAKTNDHGPGQRGEGLGSGGGRPLLRRGKEAWNSMSTKRKPSNDSRMVTFLWVVWVLANLKLHSTITKGVEHLAIYTSSPRHAKETRLTGMWKLLRLALTRVLSMVTRLNWWWIRGTTLRSMLKHPERSSSLMSNVLSDPGLGLKPFYVSQSRIAGFSSREPLGMYGLITYQSLSPTASTETEPTSSINTSYIRTTGDIPSWSGSLVSDTSRGCGNKSSSTWPLSEKPNDILNRFEWDTIETSSKKLFALARILERELRIRTYLDWSQACAESPTQTLVDWTQLERSMEPVGV